MSRLNYNKWDNLQLSDDSDIEVHPNVDKKSMIRWKQRDIHEKREQRKLKLEQFKREVPMNESLLARIRQLEQGTTDGGAAYIQSEVDRLKNSLGYDYAQKQFAQGEQPSEDHMIVSLLSQVISAVQKQEVEQGKQDDKEGRPKRLLEQLAWHRKRLEDRQVEIEKEKEEIDKESKKYITSEDIRTGWDSKTVRLSPPPFIAIAPERHMLNFWFLMCADHLVDPFCPTETRRSVRKWCLLERAEKDKDGDRDDHRDSQLARASASRVCRATSRGESRRAGRLPPSRKPGGTCFNWPALLTLNSPSSLSGTARPGRLVRRSRRARLDAFRPRLFPPAPSRLAPNHAGHLGRPLPSLGRDGRRPPRRGVQLRDEGNQGGREAREGLCRKGARGAVLPQSGPRWSRALLPTVSALLFFSQEAPCSPESRLIRFAARRMTNENHAALRIFLDDVAKTTDRIVTRAKVVAAERAAKGKGGEGEGEGVEQIQLVPASPDQTITFEVPDGPPPAKLEITGEGASDLDPELVREFLQKRWEIFESFPKNLKAALKEKSLDKVNKVLGKMSVDEAEIVVEQLQEAGILSVSQPVLRFAALSEADYLVGPPWQFEQPGVIDQTGRGSGNETVSIPAASALQQPASTATTTASSAAPSSELPPAVPLVKQAEVLNLEDSLD